MLELFVKNPSGEQLTIDKRKYTAGTAGVRVGDYVLGVECVLDENGGEPMLRIAADRDGVLAPALTVWCGTFDELIDGWENDCRLVFEPAEIE